MNRIFTEGWEERLDLQFFGNEPERTSAYICSPLKAEKPEEYLRNMYAARAYMFYAKEMLGYVARAPHGYLPMLLDDNNQEERTLAIRFGLELLKHSQILLVCGNRISLGMQREIVYAVSQHKKIIVFDESLFHQVQKVVRANCSSRYSAVLLDGHPVMAHPRPQFLY